MKFFCILFLGYWNLPAISAHAGSVDLGTYYPAPFGNYDRLKLAPRTDPGTPCNPGTMYVDNTLITLQFCSESGTWAPGLWTKSGSNLYPANNSVNVGIGMPSPEALLHILRSTSGADGDELTVEDTFGSGAFPAFHGTNRKWAIGATNPGSAAGDEKFGFIDRSAGPDVYQAVIDNTGKVGIGIAAPEFKLSIGGAGNACNTDSDCPAGALCLAGACTNYDGGILAVGTFGSGATIADTVLGSARLIWYPRKAAFRAGYATGSDWDDINIGDYSVAMGIRTMASGNYSTAMGDGSAATGGWSTAMGDTITTSGNYSTAMGGNTAASGNYSTAMGGNTAASGDYSTALGINTEARAYASVVLGRYNVISGTTNNWVNTEPLFAIGNGTVGVPSNALTVLKNGNVGIGTITPATKLEVSGGNMKTTNGIIMETRTTNPTPVAGQVWLCTDSGTLCDGI